MTFVDFPYRHVILDACCIINLYESGLLREIVGSLQANVFVAEYVCKQEIAQIRSRPEESDVPVARVMDLQTFVDSGLLIIRSPATEAEQVAFVNLAVQLDDGDAITGALAAVNNWAVATDDRAFVRILKRTVPDLPVVSTPDLLRHWEAAMAPPPAVLRRALKNIRRQARYEPGLHHPLHEWWRAQAGEPDSSS